MIYILFGKSASGKDTLLTEVAGLGHAKRVVSTTSRPMRDGEIEGINYKFVTKDEFLKAISDGEFLEYRTYNTKNNGSDDVWYYGTRMQDFNDGTYIHVLDVGGLKALIDKIGRDNVRTIYVCASNETRFNRASARTPFDKEEWDRRFEDDEKVFAFDEIKNLIDYCIINDTKDIDDKELMAFKELPCNAMLYSSDMETQAKIIDHWITAHTG